MPFRGDAELFSSATRATGSVVLLVGLILIGAFLLKRYWPGRFGAVAGERHIEVLETVALGERQSLTLVQVGQSRLLLARTAGSITLLDRAEIATDAATDSEMEVVPVRPEESRNDFSVPVVASARTLRLLQGSLKPGLAKLKAVLRRLPAKPRTTPTGPALSFDQVMRAELGATSVATASAAAARSRLSEIRNRLQAD
jgi:flagellar biosynthetic protein FliO